MLVSFFFFFNDTATTEIYTLSLHDALPISGGSRWCPRRCRAALRRDSNARLASRALLSRRDRKSTRLNSSHQIISYAVFCLKKKNERVYNVIEHYFTCATSATFALHLPVSI